MNIFIFSSSNSTFGIQSQETILMCIKVFITELYNNKRYFKIILMVKGKYSNKIGCIYSLKYFGTHKIFANIFKNKKYCFLKENILKIYMQYTYTHTQILTQIYLIDDIIWVVESCHVFFPSVSILSNKNYIYTQEINVLFCFLKKGYHIPLFLKSFHCLNVYVTFKVKSFMSHQYIWKFSLNFYYFLFSPLQRKS